MPTYEYACNDCGNQLEVVQSFSDDALTKCPTCGGKLRKLYGNVGVVFKGSGFYRNDSREQDKKANKSTAASSETKAADKSSDSAKPDAKPAADKKTETKSTAAKKPDPSPK